ncbi:hypothetical protein [Caulobacter sp. BP25]|uniref:hypothetical protein n=1 Tax=Caulobacter sp. BP25 TaxID=2048900 RepID=UPI000C12D75B|nr:hypothetical protein [Caulobacter sp. BP25]PHY20911.1 hypothetical protein CSW59_06785 [Caulobacter sp. BP25]
MSEVSELKAQVKRLEATVARQQRILDFLTGVVDTHVQLDAAILSAGADAFKNIDRLEPAVRNYMYAASMGPRIAAATVNGISSRDRRPIRRDQFTRGRNLVLDKLGEASKKLSAQTGNVNVKGAADA